MSFADLGLLPPLSASLAAAGLLEPTPVQRIAIPALLGGTSAVVVARTGSGKTLAYALPMLQRLHAIEQAEGMVSVPARPRGLVLTGTRELVDQTVKAIKGHAHGLKARIRAASGGLTERLQRIQLSAPGDILVANPPRLVALLNSGAVSLADVRVLVVDEADTLLSPGQRGAVETILAAVPTATVAYMSATLPEPIRAWLMTRPERPVLLLSKDAHSAPESVSIQNVKVKPIERLDATNDELVALPASMRGILFCNRRETADIVAANLRERGHDVLAIHGALEPDERRRALKAFRAGQGRVLVTTELGGRGLHIEGLGFVFNYELPEKASEYLHRIGRVGRQGVPGKVVNLVTAADAALLEQIERLRTGGKLDTGEKLRVARERRPAPDVPKGRPERKGEARKPRRAEPARAESKRREDTPKPPPRAEGRRGRRSAARNASDAPGGKAGKGGKGRR